MKSLSETLLAPHLGELLERLGAVASTELTQALQAVCEAASHGDVCVAISDKEQIAVLRDSGVVGWPGDYQPLILDDAGRLYLHRLWSYEKDAGDAVESRLRVTIAVDEAQLAAGLNRFFGNDPADLQRHAAETAVRHRFAIITGGPGTGKTRTILAIVALLMEQTPEKPPRLALVASTGKAAARMRESIERVSAELVLPPAMASQIPVGARTIHRLLRDAGRSGFLPVDGVIIDEASMVDIGLLSRLVRVLPEKARLILIGDRSQLASVEAGAILGDLCGPGGGNAPIARHIVELRKSRRFGENSGILVLSDAVKAGDSGAAIQILKNEKFPDVALSPSSTMNDLLRGKALPHFQEVCASEDVATALEKLDRFRVLCAVRQGPFGVEGVNAAMETLLKVDGDWFHGRPVLITENDYSLNLFNGETGVAWCDDSTGQQMRVFFRGETEGTLRRFLPSNLPPHETAFAITAHRSQGSEFDEVLTILPSKDVELLTRELLYTAITRAKKRVFLACSVEVLSTMIKRKIRRVSGLESRFWQPEVF
ncbi:MAG TPA: exodeoxyribonuclease V subunit alpha [Chthoniobacterales bacterium]